MDTLMSVDSLDVDDETDLTSKRPTSKKLLARSNTR